MLAIMIVRVIVVSLVAQLVIIIAAIIWHSLHGRYITCYVTITVCRDMQVTAYVVIIDCACTTAMYSVSTLSLR
jgi:hypothetical protein